MTDTSLDRSVTAALEEGEGLLRLAPTWVPRSFLMPGRRIKLAPQDIYAYGAHRGGIDERWFASTTPAANDNRTPDEGLSYVVVAGKKSFTLLSLGKMEPEDAPPGILVAYSSTTRSSDWNRSARRAWCGNKSGHFTSISTSRPSKCAKHSMSFRLPGRTLAS